jgi:PhnB protein
MEFYKSCLGGELNFMVVKDTPMASQCPVAMQDQIMHAYLMRNDTLMLMGSDMTGPGGYVQGNQVALSVMCSSEEEVNAFYTKLGEGGTIIDPLKVQFWGGIFGVITDRYGIRWMFNYEKDKNN